jgi:hypothetical protein
MLTALFVFGAALAASTDTLETARMIIEREGRVRHTSMLTGARTSSAMDLLYRWRSVGGAHTLVDELLSVERAAAGKEGVSFRVEPHGRISVGDLQLPRAAGDTEPGMLSLRASADGRAYFRDFEVMLSPELRLDVGGELGAAVALPLGWVGWHTPHWRVGFGLEDRWFGPGRYGGLILTDNARPAPMGSVATEYQLWESPARFRVEFGAGWLDAPRTDVHRPGLLVFDIRFSPVPALEIGATRMAIFGGEGRPAPELGQLILPTQPHIANDPDQRLPDQDELAALDLRLTLPLNDWLPTSGLDYLEVWGQYGGEDVIGRRIGPVPVPALAGIANLWGGEVGAGAWTGVLEWARLLDDTFRWYSGHRIYHAGFSQEGVSMGHPSGGDSRSLDASVRWMPEDVGVEFFVSDVRRVGAIAPVQGKLRTLMMDELTRTAGVRGWAHRCGRLWNAGLSVARVSNTQFRPGVDDIRWRVFIGL